ncbi:MAG: DNA/RNA nuclease SfsA [Planctomycetota bacterium]|nr:MAG: DNA/RNA nuclease SfsA [Planctomycetota bacterium]
MRLREGRFLRRWKRFLSEVELDNGEVVTAHCPNSGSMATLLNPGIAAWLRHDPSPKRKLAWTLVLLETPAGGLAVVDTQLPNRVVAEGVAAGLVPELAGYGRARREVSMHCAAMGDENSRFDLVLDACPNGRPACIIEIKNDTMLSQHQPGRADFPDARTERGAKHLRHLAALAQAGFRCVQFYLVNRSDCDSGGIADYIDPAYAVALGLARAAGVEVLAYRAEIQPQRLGIGQACPFMI